MKIFALVFIFLPINGKSPEYDKREFCENLECDESAKEKVCGVKYGAEQIIFKLFDNECQLLKYGCRVDDSETYGIIDKKHCTTKSTSQSKINEHVQFMNTCIDCKDEGNPVCGIRQHGEGFKIRIFENECQLNKHNCERETQFNITDYFICSNDPNSGEEDINNEVEFPTTLKTEPSNPIKTKNVVIVDGSMLDSRNINQSIRNFFAATHVLDLPMRDMRPMLNESTRRRLVKVFGPIVLYTPRIMKPENVSEDYYHKPTLSSCYHRCPTKCPDTYAPVCGVPGMMAREPSLMFQNHCFMDVAQCKMKWEDKSDTAESSAYIESSFLFCLGDELSGLYRFLPLIRTLQHMGRLKRKGHFRYKLRNMKFFNELMSRQAKLMG